MIEALLEAVRGPGDEPEEAAVDPRPSRIGDRVEIPRRAEPTADLTGWELALSVAAMVALGLMAVAVGIAVGILSARLVLQ
jgi:hypothetical protein